MHVKELIDSSMQVNELSDNIMHVNELSDSSMHVNELRQLYARQWTKTALCSSMN